LSLALFFSSLNLFNSYKENPTPQSSTKRIIKTGIFAYCRNPMYLAFILFHFFMFLTFENVAYFLSGSGALSTTAPSASGEYVVLVGEALDANTLALNTDVPVLLS